jgi:hypothetical protein
MGQPLICRGARVGAESSGVPSLRTVSRHVCTLNFRPSAVTPASARPSAVCAVSSSRAITSALPIATPQSDFPPYASSSGSAYGTSGTYKAGVHESPDASSGEFVSHAWNPIRCTRSQ